METTTLTQVTAETAADLTDSQLSQLRSNWKAEWASAHQALGSEVGNGTEELLTDPAWLAKKQWERNCFNQVKVLGTELASRRQTTLVGNPTPTSLKGGTMKTTLAEALLASLTTDPTVVRRLTSRELRELLPLADGEAKTLVSDTLAAREPTDQGFIYTGKLAQEVALEQGLSPKMAKAIIQVQVHI